MKFNQELIDSIMQEMSSKEEDFKFQHAAVRRLLDVALLVSTGERDDDVYTVNFSKYHESNFIELPFQELEENLLNFEESPLECPNTAYLIIPFLETRCNRVVRSLDRWGGKFSQGDGISVVPYGLESGTKVVYKCPQCGKLHKEPLNVAMYTEYRVRVGQHSAASACFFCQNSEYEEVVAKRKELYEAALKAVPEEFIADVQYEVPDWGEWAPKAASEPTQYVEYIPLPDYMVHIAKLVSRTGIVSTCLFPTYLECAGFLTRIIAPPHRLLNSTKEK